MNTLKTRAVAIRDYELSEQDKIITFFTQNQGLLKVVAKGARRIKSRFAASVQFPSYLDILIYRRKPFNMGILTDCKGKHLFPGIKKDIFRFAYASHLAEILISSVKEEEENEVLFYLFLRMLFLVEKEKKEQLETLSCSFKLKLLHISGYTPELGRCTECAKNRASFPSFYFSVSKGGILCPTCRRKDIQAMRISRVTILAMDHLMNRKMGQLSKLHNSQITRQITRLLDAYFLYHVSDKKSNSQNLIKHLERLS